MDIDGQLINMNRRLLALEGKEPEYVTSEGPVGARDADGSRPPERRVPVGAAGDDNTAYRMHAVARMNALDERIAGIERFTDVDRGPYIQKIGEIEARLATFEERVDAANRKAEGCEQRLRVAEDAIRIGTHHQPSPAAPPR